MATQKPAILQAAAVPLYNGRVCLVTSRSGKGWVVPKGCLEPGKSAREIALQEAWEEAGVIGFLHEHPIGVYEYEKSGNDYHVIVFLMDVTEVRHDWPEIDERDRTWSDLEYSARRVYQPGLRKILRRVVMQLATKVRA